MNWKLVIKKAICQLYFRDIQVQGTEQTLKTLLDSRKSFARLGDGEFKLIRNAKEIGFQKKDEMLSQRLKQILSEPTEQCWIGVPDTLRYFENLTENSEAFWIQYMYSTRQDWKKLLRKDAVYLSANVTRPYIRHKDRSVSKSYFEQLKALWKDQDVLIVEGMQTALGVGNDLFSEVRSLKRILAPSQNAFDQYDVIRETTKKHAGDKLVLIALGPTATVLAYDLANAGFYAIDIGHIDVEYEWFRMGATEKVKLTNRYVNEISGGEKTEMIEDPLYLKQVIEIVENA